MPETIRCNDVELECNSLHTLTILNTSHIPSVLLPFHISTDEGEIHFQEPFVICARLGIRINLWKALAPFLELKAIRYAHPVLNRIRFDHLESTWFPFLGQHSGFATSTEDPDVVTVQSCQIKKTSP